MSFKKHVAFLLSAVLIFSTVGQIWIYVPKEVGAEPPSLNLDTADISAKLGTQFQLKINQTALIEPINVMVKFVDVVEDSRCPADVVCVWEGRATILVKITDAHEGDVIAELNLATTADFAVKAFDGHYIGLVNIQPYPVSTQRIEPSEYIAALAVSKIRGEEANADISVAMKHKKKVTLVAVKNNADEEVFGVQIRIDDGKISFVKARGWDRDRIDQSTVSVQTSDRSIKPGRSLIILMIVDNRSASFEWIAFDKDNRMISSGNFGSGTKRAVLTDGSKIAEEHFKTLLTKEDVEKVLTSHVELDTKFHDMKKIAESVDPEQVANMDSFYNLSFNSKNRTGSLSFSMIDFDSQTSAQKHFGTIKSVMPGSQIMDPPIGDASFEVEVNTQEVGSFVIFIKADKVIELHTASLAEPIVDLKGLEGLAKIVEERLGIKSIVTLGEGQRHGPLLVQEIHPDRIIGLNFMEYPVAREEGLPITLYIGESASNGCTITLTLLGINDKTTTFLKIVEMNKPCPICWHDKG
ncbi:MAG: hypothetical protein ACE5J2_01660 [Nitrososphaerales archaeon]